MTRLSPLDVLSLGLVGIRTRAMRAALSALGISIGIATVIVVTGIPASSQRALADELAKLGTNMLQAAPRDPDQHALPEESVAMVARIGPVTQVSAVANLHITARRSDAVDETDGSGLTVLAGRPDLLPVLDATVAHGAWLTPATEPFPTVVLGAVAATRLGITGITIGGRAPQIMIGDRFFTVVGILAPIRNSPDLDRSVLVGWPAARTYLDFDGHPTVLYVEVREDAVEAVRGVLPATINPEAPGEVQVTRPSDALTAKRAADSTFSSLFLGLAAVALLVGGIGVANTMVVSVLERRAEIGLRRALGASRGQIRGQFITESTVLAGLGGLAGVLFGVLATIGYATYQAWPIVIPASSVAAGLGGALVIGVLAGLYPSVRAARMAPTAALAGS
ncbi:ABC transporter permease [Catenuloplanes atrovinosus]|uniref:ABC transport system permease protein n=1 Tax=Catenuloplanes atrovinosus TaxID=137266 RepID=A0AAE3YPA2_9ACTN|nr:ABC transporter permease [Catenuloplanes atrovinosus]MDR7277175.1 putative ABC transport system permease protein [Catenuloplanes atrovinosus]